MKYIMLEIKKIRLKAIDRGNTKTHLDPCSIAFCADVGAVDSFLRSIPYHKLEPVRMKKRITTYAVLVESAN